MRIPAEAATLLALALAGTALAAQKSPETRSSAPAPAAAAGGSGARVSGGSAAAGHHGAPGTRSQTQRAGTRGDRPWNVPAPLTNRIIIPPATPQCKTWPESTYWKRRDVFKEIQVMARSGFIPVLPGGLLAELRGEAFFPAGWISYGFVVPGHEKLHVRLHHSNEGWFRLLMVNKWGQMTKGMLQNLIPTGNPEVSFDNPSENPASVYVIVDDPGWMSSAANPFVLQVDRSWDPARKAAPELPQMVGIWAQAKVEHAADLAGPAAPAAPAVQ